MSNKKSRNDIAKSLTNSLFRAIANHSCSEINSAIAAGASLSAKGKNGHIPLVFAIVDGFRTGAALMLEHGAALVPANGVSALMAASLHMPGSHIFKDILQRLPLADINRQDERGRTALMFAAISPSPEGSTEALCQLLERGADPAIADENGRNALMFTCSTWGSLEAFHILLGATKNLQTIDSQGLTALDLTRQGMPIFHDAIQHEISRRFSFSEQAAMQDASSLRELSPSRRPQGARL